MLVSEKREEMWDFITAENFLPIDAYAAMFSLCRLLYKLLHIRQVCLGEVKKSLFYKNVRELSGSTESSLMLVSCNVEVMLEVCNGRRIVQSGVLHLGCFVSFIKSVSKRKKNQIRKNYSISSL